MRGVECGGGCRVKEGGEGVVSEKRVEVDLGIVYRIQENVIE